MTQRRIVAAIRKAAVALARETGQAQESLVRVHAAKALDGHSQEVRAVLESPAGRAVVDGPAVQAAIRGWARRHPAAAGAREAHRLFDDARYRAPAAHCALDRTTAGTLTRGRGRGLVGTVSVEIRYGWQRYGRQGWRKTVTGRTVDLIVPGDYLRTVPPAIRAVDGLLTLDAREHDVPDGAPAGAWAWSARWVVATHGLGLRTEDGAIFVATHPVTGALVRVHGPSVRAALATWKRRVNAGPARRRAPDTTPVHPTPAFRADFAAARDALFAGAVGEALARVADALGADPEKLAELPVTTDHALAAGLCPTGTRDWIARRGLAGATSLPLGELLVLLAHCEDREDLALRAVEEALWRRYGRRWTARLTRPEAVPSGATGAQPAGGAP